MSTRLLWGQATLAGPPALWQTAMVTSDGGVALPVVLRTRAVAPAGLGGECVFAVAHLTIEWSLGASLRITPIVDDVRADLTTDLGTVSLVRPMLTLAQQVAGPGGMPRVTQTFSVPLVRRLLVGGIEQSRWYVRGARLALLVESLGVLGAGDLAFDEPEVEYEVVQRSIFAPVQVT